MEELARHVAFVQNKIESLNFCEHCVLGKAKRLKFPTNTHSSNTTLDYVHADLWGPSRIESHGGARYFLLLLDDFYFFLYTVFSFLFLLSSHS